MNQQQTVVTSQICINPRCLISRNNTTASVSSDSILLLLNDYDYCKHCFSSYHDAVWVCESTFSPSWAVQIFACSGQSWCLTELFFGDIPKSFFPSFLHQNKFNWNLQVFREQWNKLWFAVSLWKIIDFLVPMAYRQISATVRQYRKWQG